MKIFTGWDRTTALLDMEFIQCRYEGKIIPGKALELRKNLPENPSSACLEEIWNLLECAEKDPAFPYVQPNGLEEIRRERPCAEKRTFPLRLTDAELLDKFHGAWALRAAGCSLGRPVELMGMHSANGKNGRARIREYLMKTNDWPLRNYFRFSELLRFPYSCREKIVCMEADDDIHYTLIGLKVFEEFGPGFTWRDIANTWNSSLPYNAICTAETQAIMNYNIMTPRDGAYDSSKTFCTPDFTAGNNNPYREWIGAQIRADFWGYVCAGNPEKAAGYAWRDASWTHRANGIYGEMFMAAVTAAAFANLSWEELIHAGLAEIPAKSRLAEDIRWALETIPLCSDFESFMDKADARFETMSPVHTNNNCLICVMALYYGHGDPELTAEIAVSAGLDTDCNGATSGSIAGILSGRKNMDGHLVDRLNDTVRPLVFGFQETTFSELAARTLAAYRKNMEVC